MPALVENLSTAWVVRSNAAHDLVPDACVDVVWSSDGSVSVCGPETRGWTFEVRGGTEAVGIRFHPGRASAPLELALDEIREQRIPIEDIFGRDGRRLAEQLYDAPGAMARIELLENHAARWLENGRRPDAAADQVSRRLASDPSATVAGLGRELGLSERQLLRRCTVAFGYGPATLKRILRLQRFLRLVEGRLPSDRVLSRLAYEAGYADQQHLARDSRAIARATPSELVAARPAARSVSDPSTT